MALYDWSKYLKENRDVADYYKKNKSSLGGLSITEFAKQHYENFGKAENRSVTELPGKISGKYPAEIPRPDYDWSKYLKDNQDVADYYKKNQSSLGGLSITEFAKQHYENFGKAENRTLIKIPERISGQNPTASTPAAKVQLGPNTIASYSPSGAKLGSKYPASYGIPTSGNSGDFVGPLQQPKVETPKAKPPKVEPTIPKIPEVKPTVDPRIDDLKGQISGQVSSLENIFNSLTALSEGKKDEGIKNLTISPKDPNINAGTGSTYEMYPKGYVPAPPKMEQPKGTPPLDIKESVTPPVDVKENLKQPALNLQDLLSSFQEKMTTTLGELSSGYDKKLADQAAAHDLMIKALDKKYTEERAADRAALVAQRAKRPATIKFGAPSSPSNVTKRGTTGYFSRDSGLSIGSLNIPTASNMKSISSFM